MFRASIFYMGYGVLTVWFSLTGVLLYICYFVPFNIRMSYIRGWNVNVVAWLRFSCGIKHKLIGAENIPKDQNVVVLSKHSSEWETFYLNIIFTPLTTILKKELLNIPFFGWGLRLIRPIAIDRSTPKAALKQIQTQGLDRLASGMSVLIFPEGTRKPYPEIGSYARSGSNLAKAAKVPVVFVAHDAGKYWPSHQFLKYPGTIQVEVSEPLNCEDLSSKQIMQQCEEWIESRIKQF